MEHLKHILQTSKPGSSIKKSKVDRLYLLSQKSLVALIIFTMIVAYYLYPILQNKIIIWGTAVGMLALVRLVLSVLYKRDNARYSTDVWYRIFLAFTLFTALLLSSLGLFCFADIGDTECLFIMTVLVGLSGGAMGSLFPDIRLMVIYVSIILLPLIIIVLSLGETVYYLFGIMLILYYVTQLIIAYHSQKQSHALIKQQQDIIKAQQKLFKHREALEYFYTQAPIAIFSYDPDLRVTECNDAFLELFHLKREDVIGLDLKILPDQSPLKIIRDALKGEVCTYNGPYLSMKGLKYWIEAKAFPITDHKNRIVGGVVLLEDKTNEHNAVEQLRYFASHDTLTQLSNRHGFKEYMASLTGDAKHTSYYSLLFYLDLDRFKYINDSLGHTFGDTLLRKVALRLKNLVDPHCNLTRLGGDEFVIVLPHVADNREQTKEKARLFADNIHAAFDEAFIIEGVRLYVKTSIGIVMIEPGFDNIEEIVRHADISMYQAKRSSHEHISFYNETLDKERKDLFSLQQDLIDALQNDGFDLYLQPIVNIDDNTVKAAEALIRWRHHEKGVLQPDSFIPLAIELSVINDIGWWVLQKVCQTIKTWKEEGIWNLDYISININAKQLIKVDFVERFFGELAKYGVSTEDIKVEITETSLIDNFELTQQVIHELQDRGIKCVIDDFGTGYSSLSYLKKLSFSVLKIDKEFIFDLENNEANETLIRTIVEIAKQFNYTVVVEGIEKEKQREIIKKIDDNVSYQGFLISEPVSIDIFRKKFIEDES